MISVFALQLICGLSTMWTISPRKEITSGFFRIQMLLVLGLSVLVFLTSNQFLVEGNAQQILAYSSILLAILAYAGSMAWTLERRKGGSIFGAAISISSTLLLAFHTFSSASTNLPKLLESLETLTAAWLIGSATAAMLIGHWYLTATGMKLDPFVQYNRLFIAAIVLRILSVTCAYIVGGITLDNNVSMLILRWAGLLGPLIMAILTIRILKYRNTQSATGILYAATTLIFMGEMVANLID